MDLPRLGIDQENVEYSKGFDMWNEPGTHFCGSVDQWQNGCSLDTLPVSVWPDSFTPRCCPKPMAVIPGPCGTFPVIPASVSLVIAGCASPFTAFNGTWTLPYISGCIWELNVAPGKYVFASLYLGAGNRWQVLLNYTVSAAEYDAGPLLSPFSAQTGSKIVGGIAFPPTISIVPI